MSGDWDGGAQAQTQQNLQRIDVQLDALVDITGNARVLAGQIGNELQDQNKMMSEISEHMDGTQRDVEKATAAVQDVKTAGSTWCAWVCVILTIVAIVVIFFTWKTK
jgi:syntaxin 8